ncbi:MAG: hypothetical protein JXK93_11730 [Sphaerochaetaceae bacterium]|nr:hypothetical protein [Sphaerochaetaceae bacterium]
MLILPVLTDGELASSYHHSAVSLYPVVSLGGIKTVRKLMDEYGIRSFIAGALNADTLDDCLSLDDFLRRRARG